MRDDLKIAEVMQKYDGQWVVVKVTKVDKYDNPLRGQVLFHGTDQDKVYGDGRNYQNAHPKTDLFYFYAGDPIPPGMAFMPVVGVLPSGELIKVTYKPIQVLT